MLVKYPSNLFLASYNYTYCVFRVDLFDEGTSSKATTSITPSEILTKSQIQTKLPTYNESHWFSTISQMSLTKPPIGVRRRTTKYFTSKMHSLGTDLTVRNIEHMSSIRVPC